MKPAMIRAIVTQIVALGVVASWMAPAAAQNRAEGKLDVDGKPVAITQVYAYAKEGFFDKKKQDVVVLLCDAAVPAPAVRDVFAYKDLVAAGKVHCVRQTIDADKQVINFDVGHQRFGSMGENGGSTEHVFEAQTFDGKTIAGRARTKSPQKSFKDVPYTYDITFSASIEPKK
ncbi:MAG TPA: hypothetical protein VN326_07970 [Casimicrobiaceae bacterium]|nr:hypothetical protein [Casimicrobiaceae bacterium]